MEENRQRIDEILDEVHHLHETDKSLHSKKLYYKGSFRLTKAEAYEVLNYTGVTNKEVRRSLIYTVLILLAMAGFVFSYTVKENFNNIIFTLIAFVILIFIWIISKRQISFLAGQNANGKEITFQIYETHLVMSDGENRYCIHLDNSSCLKTSKHMIIIKRLKDNKVFVIPFQAIERSQREDILTLFRNGMMTVRK